MPAVSVAAGRQSATPVVSAGTADIVVPLLDESGTSTTVVPPTGEHLVFAFCNVTNDSDNNDPAEVRLDFGATTLARGRSSMRFATFGANPTRGSQLAAVLRVTGDGSSELRFIGRGLSGGADAQCSSASVVAVPTSVLSDFQSSEDDSGDTAVTTPGAGSGLTAVGTDLTFSPSSSGSYILIASAEIAATAADTIADEVAVRFRFGPDGTPATVQQETFHERDTGFPQGLISHCYRYVIQRDLVAGTTYRLAMELDGTLANGNMEARRVRFYAFRSDSVSVYQGFSSGEINSTGAGPFALPGLSISIPDPGEANVFHTYLGQTECQTTWFSDFRLVRDSTFARPLNGTFRGVDDNGIGAADDITHTPVQAHEVLASGSTYTVTGELATYGTGTFAVAGNRGATAHVPAEFLVIAWQTSATPFPVSGDMGGGSNGLADVDLLESPSGTFGGSANSLAVTVDLTQTTLDVSATMGGSDESLAVTVTQDTALAVSATMGGSTNSLAADVGLALPVSASMGGSTNSLTVRVDGLITAALLGRVVTTHTTRQLVTTNRGDMGSAWFVNAEDEGSQLTERVEYPAQTENGITTQIAAPVDLSSVTTVALEVYHAASYSWLSVTGSGTIGTITASDANGVSQTWYELRFAPGVGALQTLVDTIGTGAHPRRWVLGLGGGADVRVPSVAYDVVYFNQAPGL